MDWYIKSDGCGKQLLVQSLEINKIQTAQTKVTALADTWNLPVISEFFPREWFQLHCVDLNSFVFTQVTLIFLFDPVPHI